MGRYTVEFVTDRVRDYMRDKKELNRLIHSLESEDISIRLSLEFVMFEWNSTPPFISTMTFTTSGGVPAINIPPNTEYVVLMGCIYNILQSVLLVRGRNSLNYQDGGIAVSDEEGAWRAYAQLLPMFERNFKMAIKNIKTVANLSSILGAEGGLGSDYSSMWANYWTTY